MGSVIEVAPVWSKEEVGSGGGVYIELTGDATIDEATISATKSSFGLPDGPIALPRACVEGRRSKYMSFWATEPGLTVWAYV